ncbi:MAG: hypothetical protein EBR82_29015 [Caulobacteraceae bacterium]|nr:hypothetical protein [Caulobacteraceae bacterium]
MSESKAEIEVLGRKAYVFRRTIKDRGSDVGYASDRYYVKGRLPSGKQWYKCTKMGALPEAVRVAKALWRAALEERIDALAEWGAVKKTTVATIGEILQAHERGIGRASLKLRDGTGDGYRRALQRLLAWALDLHVTSTRGTGRRVAVDEQAIAKLSSSVLTADLVDRFEAKYLARAGKSPVQRERALRGAHTVLRNARAVFERRARKCFAGLTLPDLTGFLESQLNEAEPVQHKELPDAIVARMARAALELRESQPALYVVHVLSRHLGMRPVEIVHAKVGWVQRLATPETIHLQDGTRREVVGVMRIEKTDEFDPKASSGWVSLSPCVWEELRPWLEGRDAGEWLVPIADERARQAVVYRAHADFVRPWTEGHVGKGYELRRWGADKIMALHDSLEMASRFLRHAKTSIAERNYLTRRRITAPITLADCGL